MADATPPPDHHIWRTNGGRSHVNHPANIIYRCIIWVLWAYYRNAPRGEKWRVVQLARARINEETSGLFVGNVRLVNGQLIWDERSESQNFITIQHALREKSRPAPIDPQALQDAQSRVAIAREADMAAQAMPGVFNRHQQDEAPALPPAGNGADDDILMLW
eukprot:CAMPEP_0198108896 /NCGR_PEP_ID=MMETSP1442-20131203/934_1 /TAXON_ID= /ORGANISM="Craspedostauros australis, Strain CCMP3328" /LENGTH=161 /DNA_ID=CAMNT_0043764309 /DNA_START=93 /DNA_END=575 /DNA_ORIENTATION=+